MTMPSKHNFIIRFITLSLAVILVCSNSASINKDEPNNNLRRNLEENPTGIKAFTPWDRTKNAFPCIKHNPSEEQEEGIGSGTQGIFYIKVPKTSSTSLARITTRIAGREAKRQGLKDDINDETICKIHDPMTHNYAYLMNLSQRDKTASFLWSVIRHPEDRAISHYVMNQKFKKEEPTVENFIYHLEHDKSAHIPNLQLMFLYPHANIYETHGNAYATYVKDILNEYNFVGIYERLHESLVVLSMIMGVDVSGILYDFEGSRDSRCGKLTRPEWAIDSRVTDYFNSDAWRSRDRGDYLLYNSVYMSLDLTIERLGKENVARKLEEYERLLQIGTSTIWKVRGEEYGCGIQGLHPKQTPYANVKDLWWVSEVSEEDKEFINRDDFIIP